LYLVMDKTMKIKVVTTLFLLLVIFGWQITFCQYAIKIEKVIVEREVEFISAKSLVH